MIYGVLATEWVKGDFGMELLVGSDAGMPHPKGGGPGWVGVTGAA